MKVLQLCLRIPFQQTDGGNIAMYNIADSLVDAGCTVKMLAFNTKKHFLKENEIDADKKKRFQLQWVYLNADVTAMGVVKNFFTNESYHISRFHTAEMETVLRELLINETFDIIQFESLFMAPYLAVARKYSSAKCVLHAHNVETIIWQRLAAGEKNFLKRKYLGYLTAKLDQYEKKMLQQFDAIAALTPEDKKLMQLMGSTLPIQSFPIGIDTGRYKQELTFNTKIKLFHLGSMNWLPNVEAIQWFADSILQPLVQTLPNIEVHLAGRHMPVAFFNLHDNTSCFVYGGIDNPLEFVHDKQIMIVPLLSGGGMRVKIIEGMAAGKIIVSTTVGAEGTGTVDGKDILIADTPSAFIEKIKLAVTDKNLMLRISENAIFTAREKFDNKVIAKNICEFYSSLITK
ncbi:MAG: glycosyltransferase family 4 protein [Bacteroidetes bacterium]|nr:glycosyltransferase family 4 protein [Bacteroidota bacterium]